MIGDPAAVSPYQNDAVDCPDGMVTEVIGVVPPELAAKIPAAELEPRLTVRAPPGSAFPKASCSWTVIWPRVALADAVPDIALVVKAIFAVVRSRPCSSPERPSMRHRLCPWPSPCRCRRR